MKNFLFGIPFLKTSIPHTLYDKNEIIKQIMEKFNKNKSQNCWDSQNNFSSSSLYHAYNTRDSEEINFNNLPSLYSQNIKYFLQEQFPNKNLAFNFDIVNFTVMTNKGDWMNDHVHPDCHFVCAHYIRFNPEIHPPTTYKNLAYYSPFVNKIYSRVRNKVDNCYSTSWLYTSFHLSENEDDFVITPSVLTHGVPPLKQHTETPRIVIVCNVNIE